MPNDLKIVVSSARGRHFASKCFAELRVDLASGKDQVTRFFHCAFARIDKHDVRIASSSSSLQSGRHAPIAFTWQPGFSHDPFKTGVFEFVTVTTTSAPRTASSAEIAVAPISLANCFACSVVGLHTRISSNCLTSRIAST